MILRFQEVFLSRGFRFALLVVLFCFVSGNANAFGDEITDFSSTIELKPDASLDVHEDITVKFTNPHKHGIFRFIPVVYNKDNSDYKIDFDVLGVTGSHGQYVRYTSSKQGRDHVMKIGDPQKTVMGIQQYHIHYLVRKAVLFNNGAPQVYWNVTGNESTMPIEKVRAQVVFPHVNDKSEVKARSFVGETGSTKTGPYTLDVANATFTSSRLEPGEGLTVVVDLPVGLVQKPTQWQEFLLLAAKWWPVVVLPLGTFSICFTMWWYLGRDAIKRQAVAVDWSPPKNLSPAEVGTLVDESCDLSDIVSTLVDLAARGYIQIREFKTTQMFFMRNKDYELTRLPYSEKQTESPLNSYERHFLDALFNYGSYNSTKVELSDLKYRFFKELPKIEKEIYQSLIDKGMFLQSPNDVRQSWICIGVILAIASFMCGPFQPQYCGGGLLSALIIFAFSRTMPARTRKGGEALNQCLGFQRFVKLAEKERIKKLVTDDPTIFGRLLPYAMVLGAADQWADAFKDLVTSPPDWYVSNGSSFQTHSFVRDIGDSTRTMGQTLSAAPASSSSGSFSSSGSSGGGFGGGGTSSW